MLIKKKIREKKINTSLNIKDTTEILKTELNLKKNYSWWNPFKSEKNQFDGVIKGNTFEIRQNMYHQVFWPTVKKFAGLFWRLEGKIVEHNQETSIILKASYTFYARFAQLVVILLSILAILEYRNHLSLMAIINDLLLFGLIYFLIFYLIPKSINKTYNYLFATIEKSIREGKTRHNKG